MLSVAAAFIARPCPEFGEVQRWPEEMAEEQSGDVDAVMDSTRRCGMVAVLDCPKKPMQVSGPRSAPCMPAKSPADRTVEKPPTGSYWCGVCEIWNLTSKSKSRTPSWFRGRRALPMSLRCDAGARRRDGRAGR